MSTHLKEAVTVHRRSHNGAHVKGLTPIARDGRQECGIAAFRWVAHGDRTTRWQLPRVGRQIRQEAPRLLQRVRFRFGNVVDRAVAAMDLDAA